MVDREGFEPSVPLPVRILSRDVVSANSPICPQLIFNIYGGQGGIRTHGGMTLAGFQDQCIQPSSATCPLI